MREWITSPDTSEWLGFFAGLALTGAMLYAAWTIAPS